MKRTNKELTKPRHRFTIKFKSLRLLGELLLLVVFIISLKIMKYNEEQQANYSLKKTENVVKSKHSILDISKINESGTGFIGNTNKEFLNEQIQID